MLKIVIKNLIQSNAKILRAFARLGLGETSSFTTSPYSGQTAGELPQTDFGERIIREGVKSFPYMDEIQEALGTPMNQDFIIDYTHASDNDSSVFSIKRHLDNEVVYKCPGTNYYVKSTLLALGLLYYDVAAFVEWVKENGVNFCESPSPEGSAL